MSQSDYIKYKKTSNELLNLSRYPHVLSSNDYIFFNQYKLENSILNTKPLLNQLTLNGKQIIFNMELKDATNCPTFSCLNTNLRANRVLNPVSRPFPNKPYVKNLEDKNKMIKTVCPCNPAE